MNLPNRLTVLRVLMIPLFLVFFLSSRIYNNFFWAFLTFVAAALTDMLDGQIARRQNLITDFGKLMDPLADKLLVVSAFSVILGGGCFVVIFPLNMGPVGNLLSLVIILSREFIVTALRQLSLEKGVVIAADRWGKLKTICQMTWISLTLLGLALPWGRFPQKLDTIYWNIAGVLFFIMMILTVGSGINYLWKNRNLFADA